VCGYEIERKREGWWRGRDRGGERGRTEAGREEEEWK